MSKDNNLQIVQPNPEVHLPKMARLTSDAFSNGQYVEAYRDNYIGNSHYDWRVSRLVMEDDQVLHHWGVWGYAMRLGDIHLRIGGIGAVVTHPDYRKQGCMHMAAQASFAAMHDQGYDLSILRGRHYVKMGYARAWNYVTYRLKLEEIAGFGPPRPYQPLERARVPEMDALYNQTHAGFSGTAVRPTFYNRHPEDMGVYAWFDEQGNLAGYVRALPAEENKKTLLCLEAAGDPRQALAVMSDLYKEAAYDGLNCFTLPHRHPVLQLLRRGACLIENRYFDISGWRVRIINLNSTLQKMIPLLERRLSRSHLATWTGSLLLDGGEHQAGLQIDCGKVTLTKDYPATNTLEGGANIARLLIGSDDPDEIIQQAEMRTSGAAAELAQVLFPNLYPMLSHWDEY